MWCWLRTKKEGSSTGVAIISGNGFIVGCLVLFFAKRGAECDGTHFRKSHKIILKDYIISCKENGNINLSTHYCQFTDAMMI